MNKVDGNEVISDQIFWEVVSGFAISAASLCKVFPYPARLAEPASFFTFLRVEGPSNYARSLNYADPDKGPCPHPICMGHVA